MNRLSRKIRLIKNNNFRYKESARIIRLLKRGVKGKRIIYRWWVMIPLIKNQFPSLTIDCLVSVQPMSIHHNDLEPTYIIEYKSMKSQDNKIKINIVDNILFDDNGKTSDGFYKFQCDLQHYDEIIKEYNENSCAPERLIDYPMEVNLLEGEILKGYDDIGFLCGRSELYVVNKETPSVPIRIKLIRRS